MVVLDVSLSVLRQQFVLQPKTELYFNFFIMPGGHQSAKGETFVCHTNSRAHRKCRSNGVSDVARSRIYSSIWSSCQCFGNVTLMIHQHFSERDSFLKNVCQFMDVLLLHVLMKVWKLFFPYRERPERDFFCGDWSQLSCFPPSLFIVSYSHLTEAPISVQLSADSCHIFCV